MEFWIVLWDIEGHLGKGAADVEGQDLLAREEGGERKNSLGEGGLHI